MSFRRGDFSEVGWEGIPLEGGVAIEIEKSPQLAREALQALGEVLEVLKSRAPKSYRRVKILVQEWIPLKVSSVSNLGIGRGLSSVHYWGGVFFELPNEGKKTEILGQSLLNVVHEAGHQAMFVVQASDLLVKDPRAMAYSPVRKTFRPAIRSFHAVAAQAFMLEFLDEIVREGGSYQDELFEWCNWKVEELRDGLKVAHRSLLSCELTPWGRKLLEDWESEFLPFEKKVG
jgi:HEXXH motif-containing protein